MKPIESWFNFLFERCAFLDHAGHTNRRNGLPKKIDPKKVVKCELLWKWQFLVNGWSNQRGTMTKQKLIQFPFEWCMVSCPYEPHTWLKSSSKKIQPPKAVVRRIEHLNLHNRAGQRFFGANFFQTGISTIYMGCMTIKVSIHLLKGNWTSLHLVPLSLLYLSSSRDILVWK